MSVNCSLYLCLIAGTFSLDLQLINGISKLTGATSNGVFRTCNFVFISEPADFESAQAGCVDDWRGNLAAIHDQNKNDDLKEMLELAYPVKEQPESEWETTKWAWAGLAKVKNKIGKVKKGQYNRNEWKWADGSSAGDFESWMIKQPDQRLWEKGEQGCDKRNGCYQTRLKYNHGGLWDDQIPQARHPYACDYKGKYILSNEKLAWVAAVTACEEAGLILAKVRGQKEVNELTKLMKRIMDKYDPNSDRFDDDNWIWTGGNDIKEEGKYEWIDGEEIKFDIPWTLKAGNDNAGSGQHALSISREGGFDDSFAENKYRGFVCQCPGS